ncbi:MAG: S41 family peptidase [Firmicutes bacterium]|nr:S41 family peptidase [Bacillota bacterium]
MDEEKNTQDGIFTKKEETVTLTEYKKSVASAFVTGFLTAALAAMLIVCGPVIYKRYVKHEIDSSIKEKAIYSLIKKYYIEDIDENEMQEGIYAGMTAIPTDQYSYYMSAEEAAEYTEKTEGNYVGIGVRIQADYNLDIVKVESVFKPSPAYDAGIKKGDILKSVSGVDITSTNMDEAVDLVRGPENTTVDIVINRPSEDKDIELTVYRKNVDTPTVFGRMLENGIGYIQITNFDGVTPDQFDAELINLQAQNMQKLIIDLRGNPGGLLTSITAVAERLIPGGNLTYTEDKYGQREYVKLDDDYLDIPLAVLVNKSSASASELFTGAVKDTKRGTIIGKNTYGKGVVQTPFPLKDGSIVKLTTSRYYTPAGICIDGVGIAPDIEVNPAEDFEMPNLNDEDAVIDVEADLQLKKAVEVLQNEN